MPRDETPLTKAEILTSLSRALDMVEGQPPGHAVRTCWIAMRLAAVLGLSEAERDALYFASLIKDSGCSNNAVRVQKIFGGDEILAKRHVKMVDWTNRAANALYGLRYVEHGRSPLKKFQGLKRLLSAGDLMREVTAARCARGAEIARLLGFPKLVSDAVRDLDEHWDGRGAPHGLKCDATGIVARVLSLAQTMEVFVTSFGVGEGYRMLAKRRGKWFEPALVDACREFRDDTDFWSSHAARAHAATLDIPVSAAAETVAETEVDSICEAFAQIVDAKSSFTAEHSTRVTQYSIELGKDFGFAPARLRTLRRAALLHDVGKLGVSNDILEKSGKLTDEEFAAVRLHPRYTWEILSPVRGFARLADLAAAHHERLDGRGYWRNWDAEKLDLDMRILCACDVFDALSADRPYRGAMPIAQVFAILDKESVAALDPDCVEALRERYSSMANDSTVGEPQLKVA